MKTILFISIMLLGSNTSAGTIDQNKMQVVIRLLQPAISQDTLDILSDSLETHANFYNIDWKIMLAIMSQESSLQGDPNKCLKHMKRCIDFGIAQINYTTWGKPLKLEKRRLITDIDYSVETMSRILYILKTHHGSGKNWFTRYHSFTREHRNIYLGFLTPKLKKINATLKKLEAK